MTRTLTSFLATSLAIGLFASPASAQIADAPSCYTEAGIAVERLPADREIFVLIDQTTVLDTALQKHVAGQLNSFLKPGQAFSVLTFSTYGAGKFTEVATSGSFERDLATKDRNSLAKSKLSTLDNCLKAQTQAGAKAILAGLKSGFAAADGSIARSDILASLRDISSRIRQSEAKEKVVLLVSDMVENSTITSFYQANSIKTVDTAKELKVVAQNKVAGDFGGARVYVIGAGLIPSDGKSTKPVYRSPQTLSALKDFWAEYFRVSNARLVEFGQPTLLNPVE